MNEDICRRRVFISGGAGFVGSNLVKYLLDRNGFDITVYDNLSEGSRENLQEAIDDSAKNGKVEFIKGDILNFEKLSFDISGHDFAVHLAAYTKVRESIENPKESLAVNATGTFNVLEAARRQNIGRFVFASSNAAVGEQTPPINESMVPKPLSPYGAVKLYGEALCSAYFHSYGLKTVALRFANVYGSYSGHKTSVVAKFLKRIKQGQNLEIYGDGCQTRDFIHARDISQAIYLVLSGDSFTAPPWGEVFQIATGQETRIIDLASAIFRIAGESEQRIMHSEQLKGEIRANFSDIREANDILGFCPKVGLDDGLSEMWQISKTHVAGRD